MNKTDKTNEESVGGLCGREMGTLFLQVVNGNQCRSVFLETSPV